MIARFLRLGPEGRRNDIGLGRDRVGADHVGRGDPADPAADLADRIDARRRPGLREGMLFAMMSAHGAFADGVRLE